MSTETWGAFHLRDQVGHITVSTMWDGNDNPGGPYETIVFGMGPPVELDNPTVRSRTRAGAGTVHSAVVSNLIRLQRLGVL